jgi:hypothetical protein
MVPGASPYRKSLAQTPIGAPKISKWKGRVVNIFSDRKLSS